MEDNSTQSTRESAIIRQGVKSSQLQSVGYDHEKQVLEIEFKGGSVYRYYNIEPDIYASLMTSDSKGKFFGATIKSFPQRYPFTKFRGTDREEAKKNPPV